MTRLSTDRAKTTPPLQPKPTGQDGAAKFASASRTPNRTLPRGVGSAASTDLKVGLVFLFYNWSRARRRRAVGLASTFFDQGGELDRPILSDFDSRCRAPNAHGRDRGVDFHVAAFCNLAGNKGERPFGETQQRRIRLAVRIINKLVHDHPGVGGQIERRSVGEANADAAITSGRDDITEINRIADLGAAGLTAEARLNDNGADVLDRDRTRCRNDLADRHYRRALYGRLRRCILRVCVA